MIRKTFHPKIKKKKKKSERGRNKKSAIEGWRESERDDVKSVSPKAVRFASHVGDNLPLVLRHTKPARSVSSGPPTRATSRLHRTHETGWRRGGFGASLPRLHGYTPRDMRPAYTSLFPGRNPPVSPGDVFTGASVTGARGLREGGRGVRGPVRTYYVSFFIGWKLKSVSSGNDPPGLTLRVGFAPARRWTHGCA